MNRQAGQIGKLGSAMSTMRDGPQTRRALLAAGAKVGSEGGIANLTVGRVIETAGASKGSFFHHFPSREQFVLDLHRDFHDAMFAEISSARADLAPGRQRLLAGARAFWRVSLKQREMRACLIEARIDPVIAAEARLRETEMAGAIESDLRAMGSANTGALAWLLLAAIREVAVLEHDRKAALPSARRAFESLLELG
jgi:TetR/AcrR family transcriptional regulator, transcriptional repressor for nem operon